ncbi:Bud-site selection protein [Trichoderma citrinoviride]|uniref:Bud-site selection protein n=1 Tax=Trichoderma citrinoviride TaxID=58853 RepID=A0A2T4BIK0_9HYPO|nr:Bud-site selection protein [Trichoderma citrinoviride]PTB69135.1 Bud-site selection protein [Trichoderma citrinoviride]
MTKRKRSVAETVQIKLDKYRIDIFKALGSAKVHERKRFSIKLHEPGITVAKKTRLEREYAVLKALDLKHTARHHLHTNLMRIKAVETSPDIPQELRDPVPWPALPQEEITLRNNVISILCNAASVRHVLDRAVADICETLGVPVPTKSKRVRNKRKDTEDQPADREVEAVNEVDGESAKAPAKSGKKKEAAKVDAKEDAKEEDAEESDFEGFGSDSNGDGDADEPRPTIEELDDSDQESEISKFANLLGGSSDEDSDEFDEELLAKYRGTEKVNLDDISVSGSGSEDEDDDNEGDDEEEEPESITGSRSPKEEKEKEKKKRAAKAALKAARPGDSTFLPTLMGGYISGSESASDIEAPRKKRRGQRARQAIWEKKYGANARHLQKQAAKGGRDAGWDMKRGAVGPEDQGRGKWRKGGRGLPGRPAGGAAGGARGYSQGRGNDREQGRAAPAPRPPTKKDNEGPLHPSWEARKKAKEAQKNVAFAGQKVVFD